MPPKGKAGAGKAEAKEKAKKLEDKTFGLKNKNKSKAVQQYIKHAQSSLEDNSREARQRKKEKEEKERAAAREAERDALFRPVIVQKKVPEGADPKSIVCAFFKQGKCTKGGKCKFSHDAAVERKSAKIDLYTDRREVPQDPAYAEDEDRPNRTNIVCKYFLEAVEKGVYGWGWKCVNGSTCIYRHALPPGYKLKSKEDDDLEPEDARRLEDSIEEQRAALKVRTPLTYELFCQWRERKKREAQEKEDAKLAAAKEARAKGKSVNTLSGRALFSFDPSVFTDKEGGDKGAEEEDAVWKAYRERRADDAEEGEGDYGHAEAKPLYDENYDAGGDDEEEAVCVPCDEEEDGDGEDVEWFCDLCDGDILTEFRYDCPVCEEEFCACPDCVTDLGKTHEHALVKRRLKQRHASTLPEGAPGRTGEGERSAASEAPAAPGTSGAGKEPEGDGAPGPSKAPAAGDAAIDESLFDDDDELGD